MFGRQIFHKILPFRVTRNLNSSLKPPVSISFTDIIGTDLLSKDKSSTLMEVIASRIHSRANDSVFMITDVGKIVEQFNLWKRELPMIEPFYAVKCNPELPIVRLLSSLGCGFDCASGNEVDLVMNKLGSNRFDCREKISNSIIYAQPAKMQSHLNFAVNSGVSMTVFDSEDELKKIAATKGHEKLQLVMRIATDDSKSVMQFSKKFGCPISAVPHLLSVAKSLKLNVIGVSFHVGSGCGDAEVYASALRNTKYVFQTATKLGMKPLHLVDIGGGFPGDTVSYGCGPQFPTISELFAVIRREIETFPEGLVIPDVGFRYIAEPGRYFVSASTTLAAKVYARRDVETHQILYVDDGIYGSLTDYPLREKLNKQPKRIQSVDLFESSKNMPAMDCNSTMHVMYKRDDRPLPTTVFGPTCDGLDTLCTYETTRIPHCNINDWLLFEAVGAYNALGSYAFNGFTQKPERLYVNL